MTRRRGVNPKFQLGIEPDKPVRAGTFLEESGIVPRREAEVASPKRRAAAKTKKRKPVSASVTAAEAKKRTSARKRNPGESGPKPAVRTRLNVRKVTRKNLDAVVARLERASEEDAVAPSEVVDALVSVVYEAMAKIDGKGIQRRGKYGGEQHAAYRDALALTLGRAIADHLSPRNKR